jgi:hypothetical protein
MILKLYKISYFLSLLMLTVLIIVHELNKWQFVKVVDIHRIKDDISLFAAFAALLGVWILKEEKQSEADVD